MLATQIGESALSLATQVLTSLVIGVFVGLFFGELVAPLGVIGDAFVLLLQMTVLPFMMVSLIRGLGSLQLADAKILVVKAGTFLLVIWGIVLVSVILLILGLPDWPSASFFSSDLVATQKEFDFLTLFIPANPFASLAETVVPAVVVFSIAFGVALIGLEPKSALLEMLNTSYEALSRITNFIVRLAPIGVFGIASNAAGTIDPSDIDGLQVYVVLYAGMALLLSLWTLPMLVVTLTPLSYRQIFSPMRNVLITAFATGNLFVVLSLLAGRTKEVLAECSDDASMGAQVDVIVPSSFNFPSAGKLMALAFVPFAGWLSGFPIAASSMPAYFGTGVVTFFGSTYVAVPFLLDLFRVPTDLFNLFIIVDQVVGNRFSALLAAVHTISLTLLAACAMAGLVRVDWARIARFALITIFLTGGFVFGARAGFDWLGHEYEKYSLFVDRGPQAGTGAVRIGELDPAPTKAQDGLAPLLDRIRSRGELRIGYADNSLPYVFRNSAGQLVGFDVDMARTLADEFGVEAVFYNIDRTRLIASLESGQIDIIMSGYPITTPDLELATFSRPVLDETLALVVRDHRRTDFDSLETARALPTPKIVVPQLEYYQHKIQMLFPNAVQVELPNAREFFKQPDGTYDALVTTAERGSAWSLIYPEYAVAVPHPALLKVPLAYVVPHGELKFKALLDAWIDLKHKDRTIERLFDYWVRGRIEKKKEPRWSIVRNVLGWIK